MQGRITMLDDPVDVFGACLKMLGHSINTRNPDELRAAQKEAIEQKEILRAYINAEVRDQLIAGDVLAAQLWSTTSQQAIDESSELAFSYPEEGFALYRRYRSRTCAKVVARSWLTNFSTTSCVPRLPPAWCTAPGRQQRTDRRATFSNRTFATTQPSTRPTM